MAPQPGLWHLKSYRGVGLGVSSGAFCEYGLELDVLTRFSSSALEYTHLEPSMKTEMQVGS